MGAQSEFDSVIDADLAKWKLDPDPEQ